jgi:hypothetical protein
MNKNVKYMAASMITGKGANNPAWAQEFFAPGQSYVPPAVSPTATPKPSPTVVPAVVPSPSPISNPSPAVVPTAKPTTAPAPTVKPAFPKQQPDNWNSNSPQSLVPDDWLVVWLVPQN